MATKFLKGATSWLVGVFRRRGSNGKRAAESALVLSIRRKSSTHCHLTGTERSGPGA